MDLTWCCRRLCCAWQVLRELPEAAERQRTLSQLRGELEVLLRPKLLQVTTAAEPFAVTTPLLSASSQALQKERSSSLSEFVDMYRNLGRLTVLEAEYIRARPARVHRFAI